MRAAQSSRRFSRRGNRRERSGRNDRLRLRRCRRASATSRCSRAFSGRSAPSLGSRSSAVRMQSSPHWRPARRGARRCSRSPGGRTIRFVTRSATRRIASSGEGIEYREVALDRGRRDRSAGGRRSARAQARSRRSSFSVRAATRRGDRSRRKSAKPPMQRSKAWPPMRSYWSTTATANSSKSASLRRPAPI